MRGLRGVVAASPAGSASGGHRRGLWRRRGTTLSRNRPGSLHLGGSSAGSRDAKPRPFRCPCKDVPVSEAVPLKWANEADFPGSGLRAAMAVLGPLGPRLRVSPRALPTQRTGLAALRTPAGPPRLLRPALLCLLHWEPKLVSAADRTPVTRELEGSGDPSTSVLRR